MSKPRNPVVDGYKVCSKCKERKPVSDYYVYRDKRYPEEGYRPMPRCKSCQSKAAVDSRRRNPETAKKIDSRYLHGNTYRIRKFKEKAKRYGLDPSELIALEGSQQGICLICRTPKGQLFVDHDHKTGVVRGLLCGQCNLGLGAFADDPTRLIRAILYLKRNGNGILAERY